MGGATYKLDIVDEAERLGRELGVDVVPVADVGLCRALRDDLHGLALVLVQDGEEVCLGGGDVLRRPLLVREGVRVRPGGDCGYVRGRLWRA